MNPHPVYKAYYNSPWPAEDAGPARLQATEGFALAEGSSLACTHRRTQLSTMVVLGDPGEVFLMTHSALRAKLGFPTQAVIESIDPHTLKTRYRSPVLAGGPMWPGGFAVNASGDLIVVYGRHAHRLSRQCELKASFKLPVAEAYNSFVLLDCGLVVTKNLSRSTRAFLSVLDPVSLKPVCAPMVCPEPSIARLSAVGNTVYIAGMKHLYRYHWDSDVQQLVLDADWQPDYMGTAANTHGWDMVIDGESAWLMDNGHHRYQVRMTHAGVSKTANRVIRVDLKNPLAVQALEVSGLKGGSVTNPPLFCPRKRILIAYDSANSVVQAYRVSPAPEFTLTPIWKKPSFGCSSHMVLMTQGNVLWTNDYRRFAEEVVALDLLTGRELARVRTPGRMQGVVFPSVGWGRDVYWCSMDQVCRIHVNS